MPNRLPLVIPRRLQPREPARFCRSPERSRRRSSFCGVLALAGRCAPITELAIGPMFRRAELTSDENFSESVNLTKFSSSCGGTRRLWFPPFRKEREGWGTPPVAEIKSHCLRFPPNEQHLRNVDNPKKTNAYDRSNDRGSYKLCTPRVCDRISQQFTYTLAGTYEFPYEGTNHTQSTGGFEGI